MNKLFFKFHFPVFPLIFFNGLTALVDLDLLLSRFCDHTQTHHTWYSSSGRVISPSHRPLADNTQ